MGRIISLIAAVLIGLGLSVAAVAGVVASNTAAPSSNPANNGPLVPYGSEK
jgi:uncharacterized protein DUF2613